VDSGMGSVLCLLVWIPGLEKCLYRACNIDAV